MKFALSLVILFALVSSSFEFALRDSFEDDDILDLVDRKVREAPIPDVTAAPEVVSDHIEEASGEEVRYLVGQKYI